MDISKFDKSIDNAMFLTKVDNIYIMLHSGIMKKKLDSVKHKISDKVFEKYNSYVKELEKKHLIQMYGELNVKSSEIIDIKEDENFYIVKVKLVSRYLNYILDEDLEFVSGNKDKREEHVNNLVFLKKKDAKELSPSRHCPSCGAHMDISKNGKCNYCGTIFNNFDYDYILESIETI